MVTPHNLDFKPLNSEGQNESILLDPIPDSVPPSFPLEALPAVFSEFIYPLIGAGFCPNFLAAGGLFTASVAIGNAHKIQLTQEHQPLNVGLFIPIIGDSASGKSPALNKMLYPLQDKHRQAWRKYKSNAEQDPETKEPASLLLSNATLLISDDDDALKRIYENITK